MFQLAIECSGQTGSVAVLDCQMVVAAIELPPQVGSVQSLAPAIAKILSDTGLRGLAVGEKQPIEWISVTCGPGSFTGLRAGLATAKMLAWAWGIPVVPVDTLHVIAAQVAGDADNSTAERRATLNSTAERRTTLERRTIVVVPVLNAFRKQVFTAAWRIPAAGPASQLAPPQVLDASLWQAAPLAAQIGLPAGRSTEEIAIEKDVEVVVAGPGLRTYQPLPECAVHMADESLWEPTAAWVGKLGWLGFQLGQAVTAEDLLPNYVRRSAAEEALLD